MTSVKKFTAASVIPTIKSYSTALPQALWGYYKTRLCLRTGIPYHETDLFITNTLPNITKSAGRMWEKFCEKYLPKSWQNKETTRNLVRSAKLSAATATVCLRTGIPYQNPDLFVSHYLPNARNWIKNLSNLLRGK